jgi:hypothetical protein
MGNEDKTPELCAVLRAALEDAESRLKDIARLANGENEEPLLCATRRKRA